MHRFGAGWGREESPLWGGGAGWGSGEAGLRQGTSCMPMPPCLPAYACLHCLLLYLPFSTTSQKKNEQKTLRSACHPSCKTGRRQQPRDGQERGLHAFSSLLHFLEEEEEEEGERRKTFPT